MPAGGDRLKSALFRRQAYFATEPGSVLDILVQSRRNTKAAKRFFKKLLKGLRYVPRMVVTDKLRSYAAAKAKIIPGVEHRQSRYLNNRAENSHRPTRQRERRMKRFAKHSITATGNARGQRSVPPRASGGTGAKIPGVRFVKGGRERLCCGGQAVDGSIAPARMKTPRTMTAMPSSADGARTSPNSHQPPTAASVSSP